MLGLHQRSVLGFYLGNIEQFNLSRFFIEDIHGIVNIQFVVLKSQPALGTLLANLIIFPLKVEEKSDFYFYLLLVG